jgi:hypothetical protein
MQHINEIGKWAAPETGKRVKAQTTILPSLVTI